jgi:hypothetical protein
MVKNHERVNLGQRTQLGRQCHAIGRGVFIAPVIDGGFDIGDVDAGHGKLSTKLGGWPRQEKRCAKLQSRAVHYRADGKNHFPDADLAAIRKYPATCKKFFFIVKCADEGE